MQQGRAWHTELSSLVITLSGDRELATEAIARIARHPLIEAGDAEGHYLPVVIEATDARPVHHWLEALPGVAFVDVVFCSTELPETAPPEAEEVS